MDDPPTVNILLLGDSECGKSTFLSKLSHGANSMRQKTNGLPLLRDLDQPFVYDIRMYNRPYRFEFYDTASPENYTLLKPDFIVMCYDVSHRRSLENVRQVWSVEVGRLYMKAKYDIPVMLLGLKRDLRVEAPGILHPQEVSPVRICAEKHGLMWVEC